MSYTATVFGEAALFQAAPPRLPRLSKEEFDSGKLYGILNSEGAAEVDLGGGHVFRVEKNPLQDGTFGYTFSRLPAEAG